MDEGMHPGQAPDPVPGPPEVPDWVFGPDPEWEEYQAWAEREAAAGRDPYAQVQVPEWLPPDRGESGAQWPGDGPSLSVSLGDAADIDPRLLAATCGPDGLGGDGVSTQFGQGWAADALRPTPVLSALTEQVLSSPGRLTDDQLIGALQATRRLENRASYLQTIAIAEYARRRQAELAAALARGVPAGCRDGEFPGQELAAELLVSNIAAGQYIDDAIELVTRLPRTLAGMADGLIDASRAVTIACHTAFLSAADAAAADEILAAAAPDVRTDTLARRATALEMKLDPSAARARRERARRDGQRVTFRAERSGNYAVSGRELAITDAMASRANIHGLALRLRRGGLSGTLDQLRVLVFNDLLQGRDPRDRLAPCPEPPGLEAVEEAAGDHEPPGDDFPAADQFPDGAPAGGLDEVPVPEPPDDWDPAAEPADLDGTDRDSNWGAGRARNRDSDRDQCRESNWDMDLGEETADADPDADGDVPAPGTGSGSAPVPALVNFIVPIGTYLGWDTTPARAGGWGLLDPDQTRALIQAAARHPATRFCYTITGTDGTALAHACAAGRHPWLALEPQDLRPPAVQGPPGRPDPFRGGGTPGRSPAQFPGQPQLTDPSARRRRRRRRRTMPAARRSPARGAPRTVRAQADQVLAFLRRLGGTPEPIARGSCDHRHAEDRYTPSRKLRHLVQARTVTCDAPGCEAQAVHADLDHTIPWPDGPTDQCNLGPKCRVHHRCKQAPGWKVEQPEPGVIRWTLPSGRVHTTRPTSYNLL